MARALPKTGSVYDQGEWVKVKGLDTYVVRAGPRSGVPVVFLHGIPTSAFLYRNVITAMHEERDCVAFDWPGYGSSAKPRHGDYSHEARERHLEGVVDALGITEFDLVIHDVGGPAGLLFAVRHPERVRRLVILNTTIYKRDFHPPLPALTQFVPGIRALARPFFTRGAFDYFFKKGLAHPGRMPKATSDTHWRLARQSGGLESIMNTWATFPHGTETVKAIREKLGRFDKPTLVLFGADDPFLPPANAERFVKELPNAQLQLLASTGHFLQEDAPEVVAERLLKFLG